MAINIGENQNEQVTYVNSPDINRVLFKNLKEGASKEDIVDAVNEWLDDHPEATTTVEDGSILPVKLDSTNSASDGYVLSYNATAGKFEWVDIQSDITELKADITKFDACMIKNSVSGTLIKFNDGSDGLDINNLTVDENATVLRVRSRNINTFYRGNPYGGKGELPNGQTRYMQFQFTFASNSPYRGVWIPPHTTVYGKVVLDKSPGAKWNVNGSWYHLKDSNSLTSQDTNIVKTFTVSNNDDVERNIRIWAWTSSGGSFVGVEATLMLSLTGYEDFEVPTGCDYNLNGAEDSYNFSLPAKTVFGDNTIWADVGNVGLDYKADTKLYIENLTAPSEDDMVANANIPDATYFMVGNTLYLSTTTIPAGDTINPGTNCTLMNLASALNALNS